LKFVQTNQINCKMNERNQKLRLIFSNINSIEKALASLRLI